jgi:hypothetical protein
MDLEENSVEDKRIGEAERGEWETGFLNNG